MPPTRHPLLWARALASLAALALLVVGAPWLLLRAGTLPSSVPSAGTIGDALTAPDDGHVLFTVLTLACWALWAWFVVSLVLEAVSVLGRARLPRIRGFGSGQRLAGVLLGGLLMLPSANAFAATPAAAATAPAHMPLQTSHSPASAATPAPKTTGPVHTVGATGETVWDLAEQYLGDGRRHTDIRALNPELPQNAFLTEGTRVRLPADARLRPAATHAEASGPATSGKTTTGREQDKAEDSASYTVRPGDYLSKIADEQLGDGDRWPELYEANEGRPQPNGQVFDDPDRIYPGQEIALPGRGSDSADKPPAQEEHESSKPAEKDPAPPTQPAPDAEPSAPATPSPDQSRTANPSATVTPSPAAKTPAPGKPTPEATATAEDGQTTTGMRAGMVGLGATGVLAAGLVGTLATRRILQQRRRRRGHRIPMPSGQTALTEIALRSADAGEELTVLDRALRTAAATLAEEGRQLPALAAVQLGTEGVRLHLDAPAPAVAPFTTDPQSAVWWCPADSGELLPPQESREVDPPYPGLIALGEDDQGAIVLVDLEHTGALHLTGGLRGEVLRTLALTLALSPLAEQLDIAVAGEDTAPGLAMVDSDRVTPYPDLADAVQVLQAHHAEQQQALDGPGDGDDGDDGAPDPSVAEMGGLWPLVVVADLDSCPAPEGTRDVLWEVLGRQPRSAVAVVTSSTAVPEAAGGAWSVDTDLPYVTVPGTAVNVALSVCSDAEYASILDVALTADAPGDVPAPVQEPAAAVQSVESQQPSPVALAETGMPSVREAAEPVGRPGLMAAFADLEDDGTDDEEGSAAPPAGRESMPGPGPLPTASPSPGTPVLPSLSSPAPRVSSRIPAPAGPEEATPSRDGVVPLPEQSTGAGAAGSLDRPLVQVLGTVDLLGARGTVTSNRRTLALEMTAWLVLHPGANHHQLDEVLAPGGIVTRDTRNTRLGDVRRWLGADAQGNKHLPHVSTQPDKLYRLAGVDCDWDRFQQLAHSGRTTDGPAGEQLLRQALELVHGRPFSGIPSRRYAWAESLAQEMISSIVDTADDLAERYLARGDARNALWAATRGLDVAREMECLWRHKFRALSLLGEEAALESSVRQLDELLLELGSSMDEETEQILRML
ncbi:LysM peptidoglycan-binding domain-containing protein [Streptomyces sp. NBC_00378]|uniref:LysM peptidoglycan-binding domain-containing protein n=1 Tax=Streptomyces sp. NBC_00378 TaxID=2975732 RepID=UPI00224D1265|nr:LysM peptidoglycan-binding domain-containing protein [Streptomyces sp. NBC_00378]MCX5115478.1 LysM peptidoglycan-binding domain-containing protein [Streptomyces sp. NBC_00378]